MQVSDTDLFQLLGAKEAENFVLRRQLATAAARVSEMDAELVKLRAMVAAAAAPAAPVAG